MQDLSLKVGEIDFSVRCGAILRFKEKIIVDVSLVGENSVIPGGRVKINESSKDAICREIKEELGILVDKDKIKYLTTLENFFMLRGVSCHQIYFLYEYELEEGEAKRFFEKTPNLDNKNNYLKLFNKDELNSLNLLPLSLFDFI